MGRPRGFDIADAVAVAGDLFWERGYHGSSLAELEKAMDLNRSSLYQVFGLKQVLFAETLGRYIDSFIAPRLAAMERPGARPRDLVGFFCRLAKLFRDEDVLGRRGCLWVNAIAEFTNREPQLEARAGEYWLRLRRSFANALSDADGRAQPATALVNQRSRVLASTTFGIWLTARFDPREAAGVCECVVAEVRSWNRLDEVPTPPQQVPFSAPCPR
jgi:TetR/AcrR family transcriptional repressor of nem operon